MASRSVTCTPALFEKREPEKVIQPCDQTPFGGVRSAAISMAGHSAAWNREMSGPMTCRSAGQIES